MHYRAKSRLAGRLAAASLLLFLGTGCAGLKVERTGETSGTFRSSAYAFTLMSYDFPGPAIETARANAADTQRPELLIEEEFVFPYLGRLDWILDILGFRYARISGTWGTEQPTADAQP